MSSNPLTFHIDFLVKDALPNVTFPLARSFAGNLPVDRQVRVVHASHRVEFVLIVGAGTPQ